MVVGLKYYNLDKKRFVESETKLMEEMNDACAHAKAYNLASGHIVIVNSNANFTDKRALDAIASTVVIDKNS